MRQRRSSIDHRNDGSDELEGCRFGIGPLRLFRLQCRIADMREFRAVSLLKVAYSHLLKRARRWCHRLCTCGLRNRTSASRSNMDISTETEVRASWAGVLVAVVMSAGISVAVATASDAMIGINVLLKTPITNAILADLGKHGTVRDTVYEINAVTLQAPASELTANPGAALHRRGQSRRRARWETRGDGVGRRFSGWPQYLGPRCGRCDRFWSWPRR